jgi:hypothetical protein
MKSNGVSQKQIIPKAPKSATGETQVSKQLQAQQAVDRRTQKEHYSNMCAQWPSAVQVLQDLVITFSYLSKFSKFSHNFCCSIV